MKWFRYGFILFGLLLNINVDAKENQIERDFLLNKINKLDYVRYLGYRRYAPEKLPNQYKSSLNEPLKCGTPVIVTLKQNWDQLNSADQQLFSQYMLRPNLQNSFISPDGLFELHYDILGYDSVPIEDLDNSGIPDFIEEAGEIFDYCYHLEIDTLGYKVPPKGPTNRIDVYFKNFVDYGETSWDDNNISYITMNNDFAESSLYTNGIDALKVTAAHEFFHVIQIGYIWRDVDLYFYEASAVWMEDRVYDDVNDYLQYIKYYFRNLDSPISHPSYATISHYGKGIFVRFIEEFYSEDIILKTWEKMTIVHSMKALNEVLFESGSDLAEAFNTFSVWNYFTGARSQQFKFYEEAEDYPEIPINDNIQFFNKTTVSDTIYFLSANYHKLEPEVFGNYHIEQNHDNSLIWRSGIIVDRANPLVLANIFPQSIENIGSVNSSEDFYLVSTNVEIPDRLGLELYQYDKGISSFTISGETFEGTTKVFPNPFLTNEHNMLKLFLSLPENSKLECSILNEMGKVIFQYESEKIYSGETLVQIPWDGLDTEGEKTASGVYLCLITGDDIKIMDKFVLINN